MSETGCDVGDILCQIEVLRSMKALKQAVGDDSFKKDFPELEGLDGKLVARIEASRVNLRDALAKCGNLDLEEVVLEAEPIPEMGEIEEYE